jgi:hypothetical protein
MKITRRQLRQIIVETIDKIDEQNADLAGFWDHDPDEVVEKDGKLMALGSATISPGMSNLARVGANSIARGKLANHLGKSRLSGSKPIRDTTIGKTYYVVIEMPAS